MKRISDFEEDLVPKILDRSVIDDNVTVDGDFNVVGETTLDSCLEVKDGAVFNTDFGDFDFQYNQDNSILVHNDLVFLSNIY